jgi:pimeloyl-ACP methyl ester carboxylesterase
MSTDLPPQLAGYFDLDYAFTLCESWQSRQADPVENAAAASDIPALLLAGQFGPVTPPGWGRLAAETLRNHLFYEFPGLGHGIVRSEGWGLDFGLQFLADPAREPDAACLDELTGPRFE